SSRARRAIPTRSSRRSPTGSSPRRASSGPNCAGSVGEAALVTISNGALTARINPLGAELWSLTDADGREYMTDADPAFWTGRAPLLFPIVGALKDGRYRLEGAEYVLPKHGFARASRFDPVAIEPSRAQFRLTESEAKIGRASCRERGGVDAGRVTPQRRVRSESEGRARLA